MEPGRAQRILALAEELGLIEQGDRTPDLATPEARLDRLLRDGHLSPRSLADLERSLAETASPPPPPRSSRFEVQELLGRGGMGQVFRAFDPALRRPVALKFLLHHGEEASARFLREARAQARLDHPNVCRVFAAGEEDGQPFIAMELVEGKPLSEAAAELSFEEKLEVSRQVADAVHAAHREGVLHRDLKPGNVLVSRAGGRVRAYVTDFGLAQAIDDAGASRTGAITGTAHFMSPEQARADRSIDRRSDVFSLGATFYFVFTGKLPIPGQVAQALFGVVNAEPVPPRAHAPGLPRDLETVLLQCLEKQPARRYPSAGALAEDLRRLCDGEPVLARSASLGYRARKAIAREPWLFATLALAAVALAGGLGLWLRGQRAQAAAQRLGQEAERMQHVMRRAVALPLHDVRPEKKLVRERLAAIEAELAGPGAIARGAGELALGLGHAALGEHEQAAVHLEAALRTGVRQAEGPLGMEQARLFFERVDAADDVSSQEARDQRARDRAGLVREALAHLAASAGAAESRAHVAQVAALLEERYPDAIRLGAEAVREAPWLYEALDFSARARDELARREDNASQYPQALAERDRAAADLDAALRIAPSDPALALWRCVMQLGRIASAFRTRVPVSGLVTAGIEECGASALADPDRAEPLLLRAHLRSYLAGDLFVSGGDPPPVLDLGLVDVAEALRLAPGSDRPLLQRANLTHIRGRWQDFGAGRGDASVAFRAAIADVEEALRRKERVRSWSELGSYRLSLCASLQMKDRAAAAVACGQAIRDLAHAVDDEDFGGEALLSLISAQEKLVSFAVNGGQDWQAPMQGAIETADKLAARKPDDLLALTSLARVLTRRASLRESAGLDVGTDLTRAIAAARRATAEGPAQSGAWRDLAEALLVAARRDYNAGEDPQPLVDESRAKTLEQLARGGEVGDAQARLGRVGLLTAQSRAQRGLDPSPAIAEGGRAFEQARQQWPQHRKLRVWHCQLALFATGGRRGAPDPLAVCRAALAEVPPGTPEALTIEALTRRRRAQDALARGQGATADLTAGLAAAEAALQAQPSLFEAAAARAELHALAWRQAPGAERAVAVQQARKALEAALALNARDPRLRALLAELPPG